MTDEAFLALWLPIAKRLEALEELYLAERVRKNGQPHPQDETLESLKRDLESSCELCIRATPEQRAALFDLFSKSWLLPSYLEGLIRLPTQRGTRTDVALALRRALAAATLAFHAALRKTQSESLEHGDCYMPLGRVWLAARQGGVDPDPYFREAAHWSAEGGYSGAVRRFLLRFHESAYFRADVFPYLPAPP
jgi:hypothetical protein